MTLVSVAQMNSQDDIENNFQVIESLIQQSKAQNASLIVFLKTLYVLLLGNSVKQLSSLSLFSRGLKTSTPISNLDYSRYFTMPISSRWFHHSRWSSPNC